MIADLINGIGGIALIYMAILQQPWLSTSQARFTEIGAGIAIAVLGALAMRVRDAWYSHVIIPLGCALALFGLFSGVWAAPLTLQSWLVFWIGVFVAVIAFWGLLYPRRLPVEA